jgi:hypothetical protein
VVPAGLAVNRLPITSHNAAAPDRLGSNPQTFPPPPRSSRREASPHNGRNAFGKCVARKSREEETERNQAADNAARQCKAERESLGAQVFQDKDLGRSEFADKYGTNRNKRNAFGKCVSKLTRS